MLKSNDDLSIYLNELSCQPVEQIQAEVNHYKEITGKNLLNQKDESGRTLAHYIADTTCRLLGERVQDDKNIEAQLEEQAKNLQAYLDLLFSNEVDLSIQDDEGNTPLHVALLNTGCPKGSFDYNFNSMYLANEIVFPQFVSYAAKTGYNFATLNNPMGSRHDGLSVLHLLCLQMHRIDKQGKLQPNDNRIARFIENAGIENLDLNACSSLGATPFYFTVEMGYLAEAYTLLEMGANPYFCGRSQYDPIAFISKKVEEMKQILADKSKYVSKKDKLQRKANAQEFLEKYQNLLNDDRLYPEKLLAKASLLIYPEVGEREGDLVPAPDLQEAFNLLTSIHIWAKEYSEAQFLLYVIVSQPADEDETREVAILRLELAISYLKNAAEQGYESAKIHLERELKKLEELKPSAKDNDQPVKDKEGDEKEKVEKEVASVRFSEVKKVSFFEEVNLEKKAIASNADEETVTPTITQNP